MNEDPKEALKREEAPKRKPSHSSWGRWGHMLKNRQEVSLMIFLLFGVAVILTCFGAQSATGPLILPNQTPRIRVTAAFPFEYDSKLLLERKREEQSRRVAPVYRLELGPFFQYEKSMRGLLALMREIQEEGLGPAQARELLEKAVASIEGRLSSNTEDVLALMESTSPLQRESIFEESLLIVKELLKQGILDIRSRELLHAGQELSLLNIHRDAGHVGRARVQTLEEALRFLRINIWAMDVNADLATLLFRILKVAVVPNLVYDPERTQELQDSATQAVGPQKVSVASGDTIIEPGEPVSQESYEQLVAYRRQLKVQGSSAGFFQLKQLLMGVILWTVCLLLVPLGTSCLLENNRRLAMAALVVLLNLAVMRLLLQLGELDLGNTHLAALLPFLLPFGLGPLGLTLMVGPRSALFSALLVSGFGALMQTHAFEFFLSSFLASLVGIFFCLQARLRRRIVRAGAMMGATQAVLAFCLGSINDLSLPLLLEQGGIALAVGIISGVLLLGLLPALEIAFKQTSDVTLLELTDHNHPLLRKMQMQAPGTYHHSLMVASLAENAALALGANALLCRTASMFHDIGKLVKPEYFVENQTEGNNPHIERNPSMSALIIKAHVKEGVEIAKKHKLPPVLIDVIRQHHGTSLIYYFYVKAKEQRGPEALRLAEVEESTYRYDGPKPSFTESAIIALADSIEAASRSLPKISPQAINELVANVVKERLQDNQLSDCTLTFSDLSVLQKSFSFTLLNMLHSRSASVAAKEKAVASTVEGA